MLARRVHISQTILILLLEPEWLLESFFRDILRRLTICFIGFSVVLSECAGVRARTHARVRTDTLRENT